MIENKSATPGELEARRFFRLLAKGTDTSFATMLKEKHPTGEGKRISRRISLDEVFTKYVGTHHCFYTPSPHKPGGWTKEHTLPGWVVWVDVDMHRGGTPLDEAMPFLVDELNATVVQSGSPGNYQAYAWLDEPAPPHVIEALNRGLAKRLGADDKWACNSLLRIPGTINHREPHHKNAHKRAGDDPRCRVIRWSA